MFQFKEADGTDVILEVTFAVLLQEYPRFVHVPFAWEAQGGTTFCRLLNRARGVLNLGGAGVMHMLEGRPYTLSSQ